MSVSKFGSMEDFESAEAIRKAGFEFIDKVRPLLEDEEKAKSVETLIDEAIAEATESLSIKARKKYGFR